jgi:UDP-GlcNAc3NAcA epimerase
VLVYGDTNSTIAGALAAAKMHVPVAHVEAGLRSFNRAMPEEINRVVTDALSSLLLCPSETAAMNLRREGITSGVHVVGDVMADVLAKFGGTANAAAVLADCGVRDGQYFVATMHRAENTDDLSRLSSIIGALADLPLPVVFPAHPRVKNAIESAGLRPRPNLIVIDPLGYASMIALATHARAVLTDSGGLQKEAYWLGVPCVTLREQTEWVETVAGGWNTLAGADRSRILAAVEGIDARASRPPLYGEGNATAQIIEALSCLAASSKGSS